ncbi:MAG: T9SS type A sorting domain-containing protein [Bacteroidales bacterium]|nr:T9SS type A sorting domain-containing protein [Bacteroidales bacterium]
MKTIVFYILVNCLIQPLIAQSHTSWLNYTFSFRVTDIVIHENDIWISTQGGLVKYNKLTGEKDYYNRANVNLPDNNLLGLFCSDNGNVWVTGMRYGVGKYTGEECIIYNTSNSELPFDQWNTKVKEDKIGNVWLISMRWMVKINGSEWKTWETGSEFSSFPLITDFDIDNENIVWMFSTDGIGKIENDEYTVISDIGSSLTAKNGCLNVDPDQNIWIAVEDEGLYKYDGSDFTNYSTSNSCLSTNKISDISFDADNRMWLATQDGLINFNITDCSVYQPPGNEKKLLALECSLGDTIWCGTYSGYLLCFDGDDFTKIEISNSPLKSNYIVDILAQDENNIWIGTGENLVKKTGDQFFTVYNKQANGIEKDNDGKIWIAFAEGDTSLLKLDGEESLVFDSLNSPFNTNYNPIRDIVFDKDNQIWIATGVNGLFYYNGINFTNYNTSNSPIPSTGIFELLIDKENALWGGTLNGLFKFDGENWKVWNTANSDIPTNIIPGLALDSENKLWFSCMDERRRIAPELGGGIVSFDGKHMTVYNRENSDLSSNTIFDIYIDNNDAIWVTTYFTGIMCFSQKNPWGIKANPWISYSVSNSGLSDNEPILIKGDINGTLWIGHRYEGISVFNPDSSLQPVAINNEIYSSATVFPNPAGSELYIRLGSIPETPLRITIYDMSGRLIDNIPESEIMYDNNNIRLNLDHSHYTNQIYIINIITREGLHYSSKFIYLK